MNLAIARRDFVLFHGKGLRPSERADAVFLCDHERRKMDARPQEVGV